MKYAKGSPEARAYMASIREGRSPRVVPPPRVTAVADGRDFAAMSVRDAKGNAASAVTMSTDMIEKQFMLLELKAEKRRHKKQEEREEFVKNAAIVGGVALAAWFLFLKPKPTA